MENLRIIREKKKITQVRLSIAAEVSQETISAYESGRAWPSVDTLKKMADFLEVSTDYLLERTKYEYPIAKVSFDELSPDEYALLCNYGKLRDDDKLRVAGYIESKFENKN